MSDPQQIDLEYVRLNEENKVLRALLLEAQEKCKALESNAHEPADPDHQKLLELADRLDPSLVNHMLQGDLAEAARQLRRIAEPQPEQDQVLEEQRKWCSSKHPADANLPYHMNYNLVELRTELEKRDKQLTTYNQKIQDWWWRLADDYEVARRNVRADMESFMREYGIKLEKPQ